MKNENGYTLLLVLLVVTLISAFSLVLIGKNINSSKQMKQTNESKLSIDLAEMGMTYAMTEIKKEVNSFDLTSLSKSILQSNPHSTVDELAIKSNTSISDLIVRNLSTNKIQVENNNINVAITPHSITKDSIIFTVTSVGSTPKPESYSISGDVVISTQVLSNTMDGSGGNSSNSYPDPKTFMNWVTLRDSIINNTIFPTISNRKPGGTFIGSNTFGSTSFWSDVIIPKDSSFTVNGSVQMDGNFNGTNAKSINLNGTGDFNSVTMQSVSSFNITNHAKFASPLKITSTKLKIDGNAIANSNIEVNSGSVPSSFTVGGSLWASSPMTIQNSKIEVGGKLGTASPLLINGGSATFKDYSALNQLTIENVTNTVNFKDLYVGNLSMNNANLLVNGSLRTEWQNGIIENSTVTVNGNILSSNLNIGKDATVVVKGNAEFDTVSMVHHDGVIIFYGNAKINRFAFTKQNKGRVILYGVNNKANLPKDETWDNYDYKEVKSIDECVQVDNNNIVYFINGTPPAEGQGVADFSLSIKAINLQNISY